MSDKEKEPVKSEEKPEIIVLSDTECGDLRRADTLADNPDARRKLREMRMPPSDHGELIG